MNTSKIVHAATLNKWADLIREHQSSSLIVKAWCEQHQVSKDKFFYWKHKLKDQFVESQLPEIVPLAPITRQCCTNCATDTPMTTSSLTITINDISIEINENTSEFLLSKVLRAVRHA